MMTVGFVGLGRMGLPMAGHVRAAGHDVTAFDGLDAARHRARQAGLTVVDGLDGLAGCDLVLSSLPATPDLQQVYCSEGGLLALLEPGAVAVDLSTVSVDGSRRVAAQARARRIEFLDAPVSGTSIHAQAATLTVMAGGSPGALERARPVLECFADRIERVGDNGAGLQVKLISNRLIASYLAAIAEAVVALERTGLDVGQGVELIRSGAAPRQLDYKADALTGRDFTPMFTVDLMRKDLGLAAEALPPARIASTARAILDEAAAGGRGADDLAALITVVERYMS